MLYYGFLVYSGVKLHECISHIGTYVIEIDQQFVIKKFEFTCSPKSSEIIV